METKHIHIKDFNYELPDERIAKFPLSERDSSKLLVYQHGEVSEDKFTSLPKYLPEGSLMVFNNTKVIQARLHFRKDTGALVEVFCMNPFSPLDYQLNFSALGHCQWLCMIGNLKRWKEGKLSREIDVKGKKLVLSVERLQHDVVNADGTKHLVEFSWNDDSVPYLNRETQESDLRTYQTVYSKIKGSVAAPTAGLHFTDRVLAAIDEAGIDREELTLHVGAGTFKPVKSEEIADHEMHSEYIVVKKQTIEKLIAHGGEAIAVGTTSVRTLESLYYIGKKLETQPDASEDDLHVNQWEPYEKCVDEKGTVHYLQNILNYLNRNQLSALHTSTQIIIAPGYEYHIVKRMVTNFHQPQSTLLLLVSAFVHGDWRKIYDFALSHDFRFLSNGDSSILIP